MHLWVHQMVVSNSISKHAQSLRWSISLTSLNLGLQLHLQTRSITSSECISQFTQSRSPIASANSFNDGLRVYLWVHSISVSNCINKHAQLRPQSVSPSSLDPGLQMHLWPRSITGSNYNVKEWRWVYRDTGVTEVEWATHSIYSGDPGVDRYQLIFISSCHTMKIHTLSFPTFGLTRSFREFLHPCNCVDPHGRVVSYLWTFLHSSSWYCSPSRIRFRCRERCGGMLMVSSLPSRSVVSPQWPPSGSSLGCLNGHLQVLLRLCSSDYAPLPSVARLPICHSCKQTECVFFDSYWSALCGWAAEWLIVASINQKYSN